MQHLLKVLTVTALVAIAGGVAHGFTPYYGALYQSNNMLSSGPCDTTNPYATTNGALWIDTGSGPVLNAQDINMELWCGPTSGTYAGQLAPMEFLPWYNGSANAGNSSGPEYAVSLLSDGTATGDEQNVGPGYFCCQGGSFLYNGTEEYYNELVCQLTAGVSNYSPFNYQAQFWTGDSPSYDSYAAAYVASAQGAAGVYIGQTPVYENDSVNDTKATQIPPIPGDLDEMPAVIMARGLMGDANMDGKVDINDLTVVLAHYGQNGMTWITGDFTGDGHVDINDLTIVLAHYNQTLGASAPAGMAAVPEPGVLALLGAASIGLAGADVARKQGRG